MVSFVSEIEAQTMRRRQRRRKMRMEMEMEMEKEMEMEMEMEMEKERYIRSLEDELRKIEAFRRELPVTMALLSSAIRASKEELQRQSYREEDEAHDPKTHGPDYQRIWACAVKKRRPVEVVIWASEEEEAQKAETLDLTLQSTGMISSGALLLRGKGRGAFSPFQIPGPVSGECTTATADGRPRPSSSNSNSNSNSNLSSKGDEHENDAHHNVHQAPLLFNSGSGSGSGSDSRHPRKQRRRWSHELHCRFMDALRLLGGPDVATPKLILQLMDVDGLTNDEVKSHLQKHRLSMQRHDGIIAGGPHGVLLRSTRNQHDDTEC